MSPAGLAYFDTSAFIKLAVPGPETPALERGLLAQGEPFG